MEDYVRNKNKFREYMDRICITVAEYIQVMKKTYLASKSDSKLYYAHAYFL